MMALFALSIDIVLPSLPQIAEQMGVARANDQQYVVSSVILGMSLGQVFYGPVSDSRGRKASIIVGLVIFGIGCVTSILATEIQEMLLGRFLQGFGAAGPRIVTLALVRDQYQGRDMARIMSIIVAALMLGPLLAPFVGQGLLMIGDWRVPFVALFALDAAILAWLVARQPETLPVDRRTRLSWRPFAAAAQELCSSRAALGYTVVGGMMFGQLFAYVSSAPQIFKELYAVGAWFPLCFAVSAVSIAGAASANARLVTRLGMQRLCLVAATGEAALSAFFLAVACATSGQPPLWSTMLFLLAAFFCIGILFGNLNALALEPFGHVAGMAAGVVGSVMWFVAMALATLVGQSFDGTVVPLAAGFTILSVASVVTLRWAGEGRGHLVGHS